MSANEALTQETPIAKAKLTSVPGPYPGQEGDAWRAVNGLWIPRDISDEKLENFLDRDPIADRDINGLGDVRLRDVRTTSGKDKPSRDHWLATVQLNGYNHALDITLPATGAAKFLILMHGGWGMTIEGSLSKNLNDALAEEYPDA